MKMNRHQRRVMGHKRRLGEVFAVDAEADRFAYGPGDLGLLNPDDREEAPPLPRPTTPYDAFEQSPMGEIEEDDVEPRATVTIYDDGTLVEGEV